MSYSEVSAPVSSIHDASQSTSNKDTLDHEETDSARLLKATKKNLPLYQDNPILVVRDSLFDQVRVIQGTRIINILEEMLRQCDLITDLGPFFEKIELYEDILGHELACNIKKHKYYTKQLEEIMTAGNNNADFNAKTKDRYRPALPNILTNKEMAAIKKDIAIQRKKYAAKLPEECKAEIITDSAVIDIPSVTQTESSIEWPKDWKHGDSLSLTDDADSSGVLFVEGANIRKDLMGPKASSNLYLKRQMSEHRARSESSRESFAGVQEWSSQQPEQPAQKPIIENRQSEVGSRASSNSTNRADIYAVSSGEIETIENAAKYAYAELEEGEDATSHLDLNFLEKKNFKSLRSEQIFIIFERQIKLMGNVNLSTRSVFALCRDILRAFRDNPMAIKVMLDYKTRGLVSEEFHEELRRLYYVITRRIKIQPVEEYIKNNYVVNSIKRSNLYEKLRNLLKQQLDDIKAYKEQIRTELNEMIRQLQFEIGTVQKMAAQNERRMLEDSEKILEFEYSSHLMKTDRIEIDIQQKQEEYIELRRKHWDAEIALRRKKAKFENEIQNWIDKYDSDMCSYQAELDLFVSVYETEKETLRKLEEQFAPLEKQFFQIVSERDENVEKVLRDEREAARRVTAAYKIQCWYRTYRVKKSLAVKRIKLEKQRIKDEKIARNLAIKNKALKMVANMEKRVSVIEQRKNNLETQTKEQRKRSTKIVRIMDYDDHNEEENGEEEEAILKANEFEEITIQSYTEEEQEQEEMIDKSILQENRKKIIASKLSTKKTFRETNRKSTFKGKHSGKHETVDAKDEKDTIDFSMLTVQQQFDLLQRQKEHEQEEIDDELLLSSLKGDFPE